MIWICLPSPSHHQAENQPTAGTLGHSHRCAFPWTEDVTDCSIAVQRKGRLFTYRGDILIDILHYIKVEGLLIRGHYFPFFLGKIQGHIFKCQWTLEKRGSCSSVYSLQQKPSYHSFLNYMGGQLPKKLREDSREKKWDDRKGAQEIRTQLGRCPIPQHQF